MRVNKSLHVTHEKLRPGKCRDFAKLHSKVSGEDTHREKDTKTEERQGGVFNPFLLARNCSDPEAIS